MTYTNKLTQKVYDLLEPILGPIVTKAALSVQFQKLGVHEESLSIEDLPELARGIEKGLIVFLGSDKARGITNAIENIPLNSYILEPET